MLSSLPLSLSLIHALSLNHTHTLSLLEQSQQCSCRMRASHVVALEQYYAERPTFFVVFDDGALPHMAVCMDRISATLKLLVRYDLLMTRADRRRLTISNERGLAPCGCTLARPAALRGMS
jgi:hypothetical protein